MSIVKKFRDLWIKFKEHLEDNPVSEPIDYGGDPTDIYLA